LLADKTIPCPNKVRFLFTHNEQVWNLPHNSEAKRLVLPRNEATCGRMNQNELVLRKTMQCEAKMSRKIAKKWQCDFRARGKRYRKSGFRTKAQALAAEKRAQEDAMSDRKRITLAGVAFAERCGARDRSHSPISPCSS
jgi:hypothetical protein